MSRKPRREDSIPLYTTDGVSTVDELVSPSSGWCTPTWKAIWLALLITAFVVVVLVIVLIQPLRNTSSNEQESQYVTDQTRVDADKMIQLALSTPNENFVYNRLAYLTDMYGPRFSGTQNLEDAMTWIVQEMGRDGIAVTEEPVMIPKWVRGTESCKMLFPREKNMAIIGLGMSNATFTADGEIAPIQGDIVVVRSFDDLTAKNNQGLIAGRIVVYNVAWTGYNTNYRSTGAQRAAEYGAIAVLLRSVTPYGIQTPHTGNSNPATIPAAAITIEDALMLQRWSDRNVTPRVELFMDNHNEPDFASRNLVAQITGSDKPNEYVVIGGHIDSWDNADGAMDDADGAFIAWEALRLMKNTDLKPRRTIRAVFWTNEENGARGATAFRDAHEAELPYISWAMESDSGVFYPYGISFTGNKTALPIFQEIGGLLEGLGSGNVATGGGGTDIAPLCNLRVPCAAFTVQDWRATPGTNNPCLMNTQGLPSNTAGDGYFWYHHTTGDTIDKLDGNQLQRAAASMAVWAYAVAQLDNLLPRCTTTSQC